MHLYSAHFIGPFLEPSFAVVPEASLEEIILKWLNESPGLGPIKNLGQGLKG